MPVLSLLLPVMNLWRVASPARIWAGLAIALALVAFVQHRQAAHWADKARATQSQWNAERAQAEAIQAVAETRYRSLAHDADQAHAAALADGDARLAAYIAAHRVQPTAPADPARPAPSDSAALPANAAADTIVAPVVISTSDLHVCDADYAYAQAAYVWAQGVGP